MVQQSNPIVLPLQSSQQMVAIGWRFNHQYKDGFLTTAPTLLAILGYVVLNKEKLIDAIAFTVVLKVSAPLTIR
jgi:hypothetical protein